MEECSQENVTQLQHVNALFLKQVGQSGCHDFSKEPLILDGDLTKRESQVKNFYRWLKNDHPAQDYRVVFAPFAQALLSSLAASPLVLVIDGSTVGQGDMALLINVVYKGRALPIGWLVIKSKKGHLAQKYHIALLKGVKPLVPERSQVIFLGDGEFDGCRLLRRLEH